MSSPYYQLKELAPYHAASQAVPYMQAAVFDVTETAAANRALWGAAVTASLAPFTGELADILMLFSPSSSVGIGDRLLAGASLGGNILTGGLLPNYGATGKAGRALFEGFDLASDLERQFGKMGVAPKVASGPAHSAANAARLAEDLRAAELANPLIKSLRETGRLPSNYVTKSQASAAGWRPGNALGNSIPGGQLGGNVFRDPASIGLPTAPGRIWYEADIGLNSAMTRAKQPGTRLLYSNDGKAFVTPDHYGRIYELPDWK